MFPTALGEALRVAGIDARTASELGMAGRSDPDLFASAIAEGYTVLTENVADFARISAEHLTAGDHHPGVLIALSSRFSRRLAGMDALVASIQAAAGDPLDDRIVYLQRANR